MAAVASCVCVCDIICLCVYVSADVRGGKVAPGRTFCHNTEGHISQEGALGHVVFCVVTLVSSLQGLKWNYFFCLNVFISGDCKKLVSGTAKGFWV